MHVPYVVVEQGQDVSNKHSHLERGRKGITKQLMVLSNYKVMLERWGNSFIWL